MCEQCETQTPEELLEELELDSMPTYENSFIPPIGFEPEEIASQEKFQKGFEDHLYLAGSLTALINAGLHPSEALGYFMNKENIANNLEVARIQKEMNVEMSKNKAIAIESNQL